MMIYVVTVIVECKSLEQARRTQEAMEEAAGKEDADLVQSEVKRDY
jgi:hypothetical protein